MLRPVGKHEVLAHDLWQLASESRDMLCVVLSRPDPMAANAAALMERRLV
jgi:hypothetical protein